MDGIPNFGKLMSEVVDNIDIKKSRTDDKLSSFIDPSLHKEDLSSLKNFDEHKLNIQKYITPSK